MVKLNLPKLIPIWAAVTMWRLFIRTPAKKILNCPSLLYGIKAKSWWVCPYYILRGLKWNKPPPIKRLGDGIPGAWGGAPTSAKINAWDWQYNIELVFLSCCQFFFRNSYFPQLLTLNYRQLQSVIRILPQFLTSGFWQLSHPTFHGYSLQPASSPPMMRLGRGFFSFVN